MKTARGFRSILIGSTLTTLFLAAAGCGTEDDSPDEQSGGTDAYPMTFQNCGEEVTVPEVPEKVFLLGNDPVSLIDAVGALDQVAFKAGDFPEAYYSDATNATIAEITELGEGQNASGGVEITLEAVIDAEPDLVIGYETETITRDGLAKADIPLYVMPTYCPEGTDDLFGESSYEAVYEQVTFFGRLFDRPEEGIAAADRLQERVEAVEEEVDGTDQLTAATIFVPLGGGELWAYGSSSMAHRQMATANLENVFGDNDDFLVEASPEVLIGNDPDVLILLHGEGTAEQIEADFLKMPGASELSAVRNDQVVVHLFSYTEPPNPLAVDGLESLVSTLDR